MCSCKTGESSEKKPMMVDKSLGTDLVTLEIVLEPELPQNNIEISKSVQIDLTEQKRAADKADKVRKKSQVPDVY